MSGHDRRPKEAAQLGAYHSMLTGRTGFLLHPETGDPQTITDELRIGIVTFAPDGTWAMHEVKPDEATTAYELALQMRHQSKVSTLYAGRAVQPDGVDELQARLNGELMDAILRIPADAPELAPLMREWQARDLPRASEGKVPPARFGEAMALIHRHAGRYQPFPEPKPAEPVCEADRWGRIAQRYFALPADLAEQVATQGAHLPSPSTPVVTVAEAQGWDRLIALAEEQADRRRREACELFRQLSALECPPVWQYLADDLTTWTESQVRLYRALWSCVDCGFLVPDVDVLVPDSKSCNELIEDEGGKRALVAKAKAKAKEYGITPVPSKWDDLIGSPLLYAAVIAA